MANYATLSLETHLFFARIMKEHALFLEAGFPCKEQSWIQKAEWFRQQFEDLLIDAVKIADCRVPLNILQSDELVTEFTISAEKRTEKLSGISINTEISQMTKQLQPGRGVEQIRAIFRHIHQMNRCSLRLLNGLIEFKENILREVNNCRLFTANYPLLIQHILREAKLYRTTIENLMRNRPNTHMELFKIEEFWNQIMMEHALFIRGLLDPCEEQLIDTADNFAGSYKKLLELAKEQDCKANNAHENLTQQNLTQKSLEETLKYREFKTAGAKGILDCQISSLILPLLADHVLREANHYIRILQCSKIE